MKKFYLAAASAVVTMMIASVANADTIRFWTTENQPERLAKQEAMAADFNKRTGHKVEVIPVEEKDLGTRATAAFAAGAEGIQMGTRFVSSKESPVHDNFKNTIVGSETNGTLILNKKSKPCIRALKTDLTNTIYEKGVMEMSEMMGIKNLYFDGDMEAAPALAGQSVGLIDKVKSVEDIIKETVTEFNQTVSKLNGSKFDE